MQRPTLYVPDFTNYAQPFERLFRPVHSPKNPYSIDEMLKCDFLLLTGGEDIDPVFYGHTPIQQCCHIPDNDRDKSEWELGQAAIEADIPIIGICRGAQWLSILAGGTLFQHVNGHQSGTHTLITEETTPEPLKITTAHHQMCDLRNVEHMLLAWTNHLSTQYLSDGSVNLYPHGLSKEPEIFYIPSIRGFGVQGHPEWMADTNPATQYIRSKLRDIYNLSGDKHA